MFRLLLSLFVVLYAAVTLADESSAPPGLLERIDRTLVKEPRYETTPKYSLVVLGAEAKVRVWIVEDGKRLYVDKNANGDLTDDGPPITPSDVHDLGENRWDFNYQLDEITPAHGPKHMQFDLRRWNYDAEEDSYGLSLSVEGRCPMYAGWFGEFWSLDPGTAPVIHFGGPLTPKKLRSKEFTIGSEGERLSIAFVNPGSGDGATMARLSIDALAIEAAPTLNIKWPTAAGSEPRQTLHELNERCCYWEFYLTDFTVPEGVVAGTAEVTVELPAGAMPFELTTPTIEVPVIKPSREEN